MDDTNGLGEYKITIGLEIHAELQTRTKMFCGCINSSDQETIKNAPNIHVCPVCMGYPGTLPVINFEAVKKVLLVGTAIGSNLADFTEFDRKNYFYPDIPKGYQISQYKFPLITGGTLAGVELTRIHLEEDTARSSHEKPGVSLVDYNRAGVPLMELVTEPVIHSAEQATTFAKELQLLLQYLSVSGANMEKGEMRVEVNLSISKTETFGTKVEIKNINSFRAVSKAIEFEARRQAALLDKGEAVVQETRGWDENKEITFSQRSKENAHDYRYFPDPDLPKIMLSEIPELSEAALKASLPELPWEKRSRYKTEFGLRDEDIEFYVTNLPYAVFFESVVKEISAFNINPNVNYVQLASNYITSDLVGLGKGISETDSVDVEGKMGKVTSNSFILLITMLKDGKLSSRGVKDTLKILFENGGDPETIATEKGLIQKNDPEELKKIIQSILDANPTVVADYKAGKESVFQFFLGQAMKITKGSANPELLKEITKELLK